ncbi:TATA-binding protein-associated factor 172 [Sitodiplosis mosellana]|uniref:TATA-binding protein-associated factor 172 n=1 Tax=Sitodiplosis mosellana TaxID=263140 RepID=UPI0024449A9D|nr:TATA-binding protein-associated factor 172 [Sitodiplosis mosellana]XP_055324395.1 TATA-binding protein-associated factor 172 [Sitodiplosis mosellana]XP_055324396.1 TATA-binding protein-associated factor 172 [Sitodiplosis mosellana]XP_055324398.1 TATA-binding protein-associated factor 172 [Sitodiplosis mosellana]XP_055324399.1 TATA-binding protein-associated factor 172 [Sitodiplosis mosellana]
MTSRLDRLFILLESGSSPVTRRAAAKQIGEVQKLHPHELHNLLSRLLVYLHSNVWDTRIAAAQAVESILNNVPQWNPKPSSVKTENLSSRNFEASRLTFEQFNLETVLEKGARLIGSEGSEFDTDDAAGGLDDTNNGNEHDRLTRQRMQLNEKLGLCQSGLLNINDLVSLDDMRNTANKYEPNKSLLPVQEVLNLDSIGLTSSSSTTASMSCRELNRLERLRRKSRQQQTITSNSGTATNNNVTSSSASGMPAVSSSSATYSRSNSTSNGSISDDQPETKKIKLNENDATYSISESVPDGTGEWTDATTDWPLESFCSKLYLDLFNPRWEIRHGAATALRELFKIHATGAGKSVFMTAEEMEESHVRWLEDAVLRLLCVLSLDRFGDFISDQVIAPVRETCAQVLGIALKAMPTNVVQSTVEILMRLMKHNEWEVRHGGLLGIKYMLVVREDLMQTFLPFTINNILAGLFDPVDDVGAVAASTLIPIAGSLPKLLSIDQVSSIVKMLWDLLLDQDELASACNSFMGLLAAILSLPNASQWLQMEPMNVLIPRLWPFLSHTTSSVRKSTLHTLKTLTQCNAIIETTNGSNEPACSNDKMKLSEQSASDFNKIVNVNAKNLSLNFGVKEWPSALLQESLRHIYQRVLVEHVADIQSIAEDVWVNLVTNAELSALLHAACPYVSAWMCLAMQPARLAFDPSLMTYAKTNATKERSKRQNDLDLSIGGEKHHPKMYLGGIETTPADVRERNIPRARCIAAKMIGLLSKYLILPAPGAVYTVDVESPIQCYTKLLIGYLSSRSALQRLISGMVISFWAVNDPGSRPGPPVLQEKLHQVLNEFVYYDEVAFLLTRLLQESRDFIATMKQYKIPFNDFDSFKVLTIDQIQALATTHTENLRQKHPFLKTKTVELLEERRRSLQQSLAQTNHEQNILNVSTLAILAGATVNMESIPDRLNPVVKPLMESIKRERCQIIQQLAAQYLVKLLDFVRNRNPNPINKIVINLCHLLKSDLEFTPRIMVTEKMITDFEPNEAETDKQNPYHGMLTLTIQGKGVDSHTVSTPRGPGRPPLNDVTIEDLAETDDPCREQNRIQRIGAQFAIQAICTYFGKDLIEKVPIFWGLIKDTIKIRDEDICAFYATGNDQKPVNFDQSNELILCLQLIECSAVAIHPSLSDDLLELLPKLNLLLKHPLKAVRHMAARCLATLALIDSSKVMDMIVKDGLIQLQTIENLIYRQGAVEAISCIVNKLQFEIVPYVLLLIIPLLGRMSDPDKTVRLLSTHCFATLIQLMPLDSVSESKSSILSKDLLERKTKDEEFLECLFSPKKIPNFNVPVPIDAELRSYQQSGVNWLWFLNKYKLHGILADDMGLGKTLQAICILAGDHQQRMLNKDANFPSLVICPPTLTGHWVYEVNKFVSNEFLKPLHYVGFPNEREKLRPKISSHNLVVASYDIVRKDIAFFSQIHWNYVILDEGHIIKNGKTKCSQAMKQLIANHRLILSGTPIQNNVLELWSLFDFLMPGFLGTEKQFCSKFSRPILASRDAKSSAKDQEAGALAMESLHRQVLPFILRRVKEDVLTDLPPKITQDLLCELSPLQERLYEDFSKTHLNSDDLNECLESIDRSSDGSASVRKTHIFQALRYLQNVCNHPKLVLTKEHPEYQIIQDDLAKSNRTLNDIDNAAKLPALKQLLSDCGIGNEAFNGDPLTPINQHRALIFCQLKAMLNIVENDLLKKHMPTVSYLRLDGSIPAASRHQIVTKFNSDPSIDVLLLTTQVGGLGLNLTGADTVIFVEHDWNPMKDLQAMDRAHRIGQKKVVNVYRLITRKSLEEKIMGLQKFKLLTANTIVSEQNASMDTMATEQLFDLFTLADDASKTNKINKDGKQTNVSLKQALENLPDLWEDKEYEEEYDMTQFIKTLKS